MSIMHQRIKELRTQKGITLLAVAEYLGVTEATAQRYETGKGIKTIPYEAIEKYANLFHCSPSYILGWEDSEIEAVATIHEESFETFIQDKEQFVQNQVMWMQEVGTMDFTPAEASQIIDFAKFVISKRKV